MTTIDIETIKKLAETLKANRVDPADKFVFFAYCSKHKTVHSSEKRDKDCFVSFFKSITLHYPTT